MRYLLSVWCAVLSCSHVNRAKAQEAPPPPPARVMIEIGDVSESSVGAVVNALESLQDDPAVSEIWLRIDSHGGEIDSGMHLIQAFDHLKKPLTCVVDTKAYSMGAVILEACPMRLMTSRSTIMLHEALVQQAAGNEHDLSMTAAALHAITESLVQVCADRMGLTSKQFHKHIDNTQWWMSADEALTNHAVDALIKPSELPELTKIAAPPRSLLELLGAP